MWSHCVNPKTLLMCMLFEVREAKQFPRFKKAKVKYFPTNLLLYEMMQFYPHSCSKGTNGSPTVINDAIS